MLFKNQLKEIIQKYPFIHIDQSGELSIIVPLTGARKITDNFSNDPDEPISIFLFGDNTCKADLERQKFFMGTLDNNSNSFSSLFPKLMQELEALFTNTELTEQDRLFLRAVIKILNDQKVKAHTFERGNPGQEIMNIDFTHGDEIFTAKGEFIVKTLPDNYRTLNLPNVVSLAQPRARANQKLISQEISDDCLEALSHIQEPVKVNPLLLVPEAIKKIPEIRGHLNQNPADVFLKIYQFMQEKNKSLKDIAIGDGIFEGMADNLEYYGAEGDYGSWTDEEITDTVKTLFSQAHLVDESENELKTFAAIYAKTVRQYKALYSERDDVDSDRTKTYQLFVLQTFLYLCVMELRLKNKEDAQNFLKVFQDRDTLNKLIAQLCTDEKSFIKMMGDKFHLSLDDYHSIIDAAHIIAVDHLEADHFDELRVACSTDLVHNAHYIVMGGGLCWSTAPITERGNLNSLAQRNEASHSHFETFYDQREMYPKRLVIFEVINKLLNKPFDEEARQYCLLNVQYLSTAQKNALLTKAINFKKYPLAQMLIEQSEKEFFNYAFITALKQYPANPAFIDVFLKKDPKYAKYIEGENFLDAVCNGELELVKLILKYKPELVEYRDNYKQTPLIHACSNGKVDVVEYLMGIGANIHGRAMIPLSYEYKRNAVHLGGRTGRDWAEALQATEPEHSAKIISLFDNYYQNLESNFKSNPAYKDSFNANHLKAAINHGDLKLINLYRTYCPHLRSSITDVDLTQAAQNSVQQELLAQIIPYQETYRNLLAEIQRKEINLREKYENSKVDTIKCIHLLSNKLTKAGNDFFLNELTPESLQNFKEACTNAMDIARPTLRAHRGWHGYPDFFRAILGVLSALTVIPALVVAVSTPKGYVDTFFSKKEKVKTDSIEKLDQFEEDLNEMNTTISGVLNNKPT